MNCLEDDDDDVEEEKTKNCSKFLLGLLFLK